MQVQLGHAEVQAVAGHAEAWLGPLREDLALAYRAAARRQLKDAAGAIDTAGSTNRRIARGQCYDKAIYGFTILVLVGGLVFLIYWMVFHKKD